jgi:hypothetical protein
MPTSPGGVQMLSPSEAWPVVQEAILVFRANVPDMAKARQALAEVLKTGAWRSYDSPTGAKCIYDDFAVWVAAPVPLGLHTTVDNLWEIAKGDAGLLGALDEALRNPPGGDRRSADFKIDNIRLETPGDERPQRAPNPGGTAKRQALRKLRKEADSGNEKAAELHAEVLAGRITAHAAMVQAGFRPKTISVPVSKPERVAAYLRKHMPRESLLRLAELLTKED